MEQNNQTSSLFDPKKIQKSFFFYIFRFETSCVCAVNQISAGQKKKKIRIFQGFFSFDQLGISDHEKDQFDLLLTYRHTSNVESFNKNRINVNCFD